MDTKRCSRCHEAKPVTEFYKNVTQPDGLNGYCKSCWKQMYKDKREAQRAQTLEATEDARFIDFGKQVLDGRKVKGWTQERLGEMLGVTGTQVRLWEKGKAVPQQDTLKRLCNLLGMEIPLSVTRNSSNLFPVGVAECANPQCRKQFPVYKTGVRYCSKECAYAMQGERQTGENNPVWNGGKFSLVTGYVKVKVGKDHPMADDNGYTMQHRLVMSQILGRPLGDGEHVHHKNGDRADNRPENLELWSGRKDPAGQRQLDLAKDLVLKLSPADQQELQNWLQDMLAEES